MRHAMCDMRTDKDSVSRTRKEDTDLNINKDVSFGEADNCAVRDSQRGVNDSAAS